MGEYFENIGSVKHLAVIIEADPRLLWAVAIPVGEAVIDQLQRRIISERGEEDQRDQQKGDYDNSFLFVIRQCSEHRIPFFRESLSGIDDKRDYP
jgi:hypothetical protein